VTERLTIRTPRYWLAPAILAVAAWLDNDKDRYFDSVNSALALNRSKAALFMTLLLRHQARTEVMREWIGTYLGELKSNDLPTDFAVVIEAVAGGTLGADSAPQLARTMRRWYNDVARNADAKAEEIGQWERNLLSWQQQATTPNNSPPSLNPARPGSSSGSDTRPIPLSKRQISISGAGSTRAPRYQRTSTTRSACCSGTRPRTLILQRTGSCGRFDALKRSSRHKMTPQPSGGWRPMRLTAHGS
jgi:hypothetical protein